MSFENFWKLFWNSNNTNSTNSYNYKIHNELLLVFTKATGIHFCELWLAPITRDIQGY